MSDPRWRVRWFAFNSLTGREQDDEQNLAPPRHVQRICLECQIYSPAGHFVNMSLPRGSLLGAGTSSSSSELRFVVPMMAGTSLSEPTSWCSTPMAFSTLRSFAMMKVTLDGAMD